MSQRKFFDRFFAYFLLSGYMIRKKSSLLKLFIWVYRF